LIPTSRPAFNPPAQKTQLVDIPGANGQLDLSCVLTGHPIFQNRTGSIEFAVENGHRAWNALYSEIMNYLHGQTMLAVLEDDTGYCYEGRFTVSGWKSDKLYSVITIDYDVYPYKRERISTTEDWLWDPFDFETGYIRDKLVDLAVTEDEPLTVTIEGTSEYVVPTITATVGEDSFPTKEDGLALSDTPYLLVSLNAGEEYVMFSGAHTSPLLELSEGTNTLTFRGSGSVTIDYRGGSL